MPDGRLTSGKGVRSMPRTPRARTLGNPSHDANLASSLLPHAGAQQSALDNQLEKFGDHPGDERELNTSARSKISKLKGEILRKASASDSRNRH